MADGTVELVENIKKGDKLMGPDRTPRTVNYLARGRQEMFRVIPQGDTGAFEVNLDHKMRVWKRGELTTITVQDYLDLPSETKELLTWENQGSGPFRFSIESLGVGDFYGFNITGDHLYLDSALTEHHNTGSMEELRQQIAEKGIPIFKALEEQLGVTGAELNKMIQEGKVSADVVLGLFTDVAKGKGPLKAFAGGADKMATTFQGKVGRMRTHWSEFLKRFGAPIIDALMPIMDDLLVIMKRMILDADSWGSSIANAISKIENLTNPIATMAGSLDGFSKAWDAFVDYAVRSFINKMTEFYVIFRVSMESQISLLAMYSLDVLTTAFRDIDFWRAIMAGQVEFFLNFTASLTNAATAFVRKIEEAIPLFAKLGLGDKMQAGAESLARGLRLLGI